MSDTQEDIFKLVKDTNERVNKFFDEEKTRKEKEAKEAEERERKKKDDL